MARKKPINAAAQKLEELLDKMSVKAKVEVVTEDPPVLNISLDEPGSLIGHRGDGVRSLQHILRLFLLRAEIELPVVVDIEGYRERQRAQLQELAKRKAEEVRSGGRMAILAPMSSYERRLVHMAVADFDDLVTESMGEGQNRRVMIKKKD